MRVRLTYEPSNLQNADTTKRPENVNKVKSLVFGVFAISKILVLDYKKTR